LQFGLAQDGGVTNAKRGSSGSEWRHAGIEWALVPGGPRNLPVDL